MHEDRLITFSGYNWLVTNSIFSKVGPGPNFFSADLNDVFTQKEKLYMRTRIKENVMYSSQIVCTQALGYGTYVVSLASRVDNLARNAVFSGFLYQDDSNEIDIEFSSILAGTGRGQYVVQPWYKLGHVKRFTISSQKETTYKIIWSEKEIIFESYEIDLNDSTKIKMYSTWSYKKKSTIDPKKAVFIFNLWLYKGVKPQKEDEVIISSFSFHPLED